MLGFPRLKTIILLSLEVFVTKHISNHVIKHEQYCAVFIWIALVNIFVKIIHITSEFNKNFKIIKMILSISGWWLINLRSAFNFPDLEPPIINILYGWSGICGKLCSFMISPVTLSIAISFVYCTAKWC